MPEWATIKYLRKGETQEVDPEIIASEPSHKERKNEGHAEGDSFSKIFNRFIFFLLEIISASINFVSVENSQLVF